MRIETGVVWRTLGGEKSHPDREIGVRIETAVIATTANDVRVTPIVRSGCGLKPRKGARIETLIGSPRS